MTRDVDPRNGRPLDGDHEAVETLTDDELDIELLIAAAAVGKMRTGRLSTLNHELGKRRFRERFPAGALRLGG